MSAHRKDFLSAWFYYSLCNMLLSRSCWYLEVAHFHLVQPLALPLLSWALSWAHLDQSSAGLVGSGLCGKIIGDGLIRMASQLASIWWCSNSCCSSGFPSVQMCSMHPAIRSAFSSTSSALYVACMIQSNLDITKLYLHRKTSLYRGFVNSIKLKWGNKNSSLHRDFC